MSHSSEMFLDQQEFENQNSFTEQEHPLPTIDMNSLVASDQTLELQLGGSDKPEKFNLNSFNLAQGIIQAIQDGRVNPLEFAVKRKILVDAMDIAMKEMTVKDIMITEIEKFGKEGASSMGAKISITSRGSYDYSKDPTWATIKDSMKIQEEALKAQEDKIKAACKNNASLVNEDGVIVASVVPHPETKSIAVSFNKKKK